MYDVEFYKTEYQYSSLNNRVPNFEFDFSNLKCILQLEIYHPNVEDSKLQE